MTWLLWHEQSRRPCTERIRTVGVQKLASTLGSDAGRSIRVAPYRVVDESARAAEKRTAFTCGRNECRDVNEVTHPIEAGDNRTSIRMPQDNRRHRKRGHDTLHGRCVVRERAPMQARNVYADPVRSKNGRQTIEMRGLMP